ncbi:uncharacterized protein DAT39_002865 [Clarias magur]|uniref:Uncharacterized protein n=1 Tax=Clarias magur TaxID=1594786 RepID=A0A8J4UNT7_CLAMG|nr:uncharacterized protein DAT39_002865 [Clarias magur]
MFRTARQPTPPSTVVRPRRRATPPRYLDDFYIDYTVQRQPICSDDVQQICGTTGLELGERPTSLVPDTGSRPELARDVSTGSIDRISLREIYQDLPQPQSQTPQVSNAEQSILNTSPDTAAIGGRSELPRDQDDLPQLIRALPVHA